MLSREIQEPGWNLRAPTIAQVQQLAEEMDDQVTDAKIDEVIQMRFPNQLSAKSAKRMREAVRTGIEKRKKKNTEVMSLTAEEKLQEI